MLIFNALGRFFFLHKEKRIKADGRHELEVLCHRTSVLIKGQLDFYKEYTKFWVPVKCEAKRNEIH
jgi:hypothetical protein